MSTLKNLVHKGVKVELGLPYELWDEPSVEVTHMKKQVRPRISGRIWTFVVFKRCVCVCLVTV